MPDVLPLLPFALSWLPSSSLVCGGSNSKDKGGDSQDNSSYLLSAYCVVVAAAATIVMLNKNAARFTAAFPSTYIAMPGPPLELGLMSASDKDPHYFVVLLFSCDSI